MKFRAAMDLVPVLAAQLAACHQRVGMSPPDLLLPVPLSKARLRERGYNQSWELARRAANHLNRPAHAHMLSRLKDTPHQLALPLNQRAANVRGAFAVDPRWSDMLKGRNIALIDDVMTTGATAGEAARVLRETGAASVQVWVVARTPAPADA
jgi:ComF family protein